MTRTEKLAKIEAAEARRREESKELRRERKYSQLSGFVLSLGEVLDTLIPGRFGSKLGKAVVRRRIHRRAVA